MLEIGTKVRRYRHFRDLSQAQLAERVGVTRQTINRIEKGQHNPSMKLLDKLSKELEFSLLDDRIDKLHEFLRDLQSLFPDQPKS